MAPTTIFNSIFILLIKILQPRYFMQLVHISFTTSIPYLQKYPYWSILLSDLCINVSTSIFSKFYMLKDLKVAKQFIKSCQRSYIKLNTSIKGFSFQPQLHPAHNTFLPISNFILSYQLCRGLHSSYEYLIYEIQIFFFFCRMSSLIRLTSDCNSENKHPSC